MDRLSASFVGDNYLNGGLQNALSESQTRRGALLEKLKDAQDTLQVRFELNFKAQVFVLSDLFYFMVLFNAICLHDLKLLFVNCLKSKNFKYKLLLLCVTLLFYSFIKLHGSKICSTFLNLL